MSEKFQKREDGRVRYTKMRIRSALYELLKEMDYEKITVTAVCNKAEINRATFYKHYLDIPDLIDKLQEETINEFARKLDSAVQNNPEDFIIDFLKFLKSQLNEDNDLKLFSISSASSFTAKISSMIYTRFASIMMPKAPKDPSYSMNTVFAYITGGCAGIIDYWIKSGCKEKEETIAATLTTLASSTINSLV